MIRRVLLWGILVVSSSGAAAGLPSPGGGDASCAIAGFDGADGSHVHPRRVTALLRPGVSLDGTVGMAGGVRVVRAEFGVEIVDPIGTFRLGRAIDAHEILEVSALVDMTRMTDPEAAERHRLHRYVVIEAAPGVDLVAMADELAEVGAFERIDADRRGSTGVTHGRLVSGDGTGREDLPTNDPLIGEQWGLENVGQVICGRAGVPGADVNAPGAWARYVAAGGGAAMNVAIVDAGVSPTHPDLAGRVVGGINFAGGPPDDWDHGSNNHGTFCAGIVAAIPDNGIGIAGVAWDANIYSVRVFNDFGIGFENEVINGLEWCSQNDIEIINMSLGFSGASSAFADMVSYIDDIGMLMIASTGNSAAQNVQYPAAFPEVVAVTATNNSDALWSNSTTGPEVDISAPGWGMVSLLDTPTSPDSYRDCDNGTSWAAPMVTGAACLVWSRRPSLTAAGVRAILEATSTDLGAVGWDEQFGWGRLDVEAALAALQVGYPTIDLTCLGDLTGDGSVDITDLLLFLLWFAEEHPSADLAPPEGLFDFADIIAYLERFVDGCGARSGGS